MRVILFTHPKIENRKCFGFFQKKNKIKRFYFWKEMATVDEIEVDGVILFYDPKIENRKCFRFFQKKAYAISGACADIS
jgi:hypothetical protein